MDTNKYKYCLGLAQDFLKTKKRIACYLFTVFDDIYDEEESYLNALEDKEVEEIKALKREFGDDYVHHQISFLEDPEICFDYTRNHELLSIDIDNPCYQYVFGVHFVQKDKVVTNHLDVILSDEHYIKLLAYCLCERGMTYNKLWRFCKELFEGLQYDIYSIIEDRDTGALPDYAFYVTMDEVQKDAEMILQDVKISALLSNDYYWFSQSK